MQSNRYELKREIGRGAMGIVMLARDTTLGRDVAIVCLPGEVFVELGLAIKQGSPFRTTLVIELSNSVETIYIPNRAAYAGGSYEVTNSAVQPGSGEMLVEAALSLLREAATVSQSGRKPTATK